MKKAAAAPAAILVLALLGWGLVDMEIGRPGRGLGDAMVEIRAGTAIRGAARELAEAGVISSPLLFELEARLAADGKIMAGEYLLSRGLSIRGVVEKLRKGDTILRPVTVPEGFNMRQVAQAVEKAGLAPAEDILKAARDPQVLARWRILADSAEGYLFPETYHFRKGEPARRIVNEMIKTFFREAGNIVPEDVLSDPPGLKDLVTLASIVEKETSAPHERELVAAVFRNRLERGMPLQSDPTVIYALPDYGGNIRKADLSYDSPYNTYVKKGLPPGPIASPGLLSLKAASSPADEDYLYFVSKNDGEHVFSRTLAEHNRAVRRYQQAGRASK